MWNGLSSVRGGLVAEGTIESFDEAKTAVREALADRYPEAARAINADAGSVDDPVLSRPTGT